MALELDWIDNTTGVTYNGAYAMIQRVSHTRLTSNNHQFVIRIQIYKDATARSDGKAPITETMFTVYKTINASDNSADQRNIINQLYNDMKQDDPWDDATDV